MPETESGKMEELKKQRATAKRRFTRKCNAFKESVDQEDPTPVLQHTYDEVSRAYKEVESAHETYTEYLSRTGVEEKVLDEEDQYIIDLERKRKECHILLARNLERQASVNNVSAKKVKVKALEPPTFDGDVREFPTFKADFERLMKDSFGKDPFALKQCLTGEALKTVKGVETDYDEMFKRLNERYGNSRKIVDVVLCDLKTLRKLADGDTKGFVKMVEKVERCWLDLKRMNLTAEMKTSNTVSHIEKTLPMTQKREWVLLAEDITDPDKIFDELLKFLLKEKRVLENMESSIRVTGNADRSNVHNVTGSLTSDLGAQGDSGDIIKAIKMLQENQECQSKKLEQCMTNLTNIATSMTNNGTSQNTLAENSIRYNCWLHGTDNHDILECVTFQRLDNYGKINALRRNGICFNCLKGVHVASQCNLKKTCDVRGNNSMRCDRPHHNMLHRAHVEGIMFHSTSQRQSTPLIRKTLLMISKVLSRGRPITTLWDSGSDITIITHTLASKYGLQSKDVDLSMTKVGNVTEKFPSKEYILPLTDKDGNELLIRAVGMNEISSDLAEVDVSEVVSLFKEHNISHCDIERPSGSIDLLIGTDNCELLPTVIGTNGKLQLMQNRFGLCIRGSHPRIRSRGNSSSHVSVRVNHLANFSHINDILVEPKSSIKASLDDFFHIDNLGTQCTPKCGSCKCGKCGIGNNNYSIKEEKELAIIEKGLHYDEANSQWTVEYPWIKDPRLLPNNISVAIARMKSTEKRLVKLGPNYSKSYQDQIEDMIIRNVCRKLSEKEMQFYNGPIHYVQHHEVHKPDSLSTPLRIVFNSSASYMGHILNDYWCKGPNILNNQLAVLFRFRQREVAIVGDISKMYHTIKLSLLDQHTHRFVWRDMRLNDAPDHYALTAVAFGDKPSGIIAMLALKHTIEMNANNYPKVAEMIINNTYVDDILYSTNTKTEAYDLIRDAEKVLSSGNFKIKHWIVSGVNTEVSNVNLYYSDKEKILGLIWNPEEDYFTYKVKVNFSEKQRKVHIGPDLTRVDIEAKLPEILTKRIILSQVASIYDPLGLITPFTLKAKILMRKLVTQNNDSTLSEEVKCRGWDDPLSNDERETWKSFFLELYDLETIFFNRCLRPTSAIGNPILVIFSDGSNQAYGTCAYIRWKLGSGKYEANLIAAKGRIAPTRQLTIPRLELCGAVLACRLREVIVKEFNWTFDYVVHIVDSAIVRAQVQKESYGFNTFVAIRVAEIQTKSSPDEWWWVKSGDNPADLTTRPTSPTYLGKGSIWQNGPEYLRREMTSWPISKYLSENSLPDRVGVTFLCNSTEKSSNLILSVMNIEKYSSYNKLLRVTARVFMVFKNKSFKAMFINPPAEMLKFAEKSWVKEVQKDIPPDWNTRYQRLGPSINDEGIIVVGERISKWLKDNWNCNSFTLLICKHPFSKLYIRHLHNIDHAGTDVTLAKLQDKYWIPGVRREIKSIKNKCVKCRKWSKSCEGQKMGQLIPERLKPSPPFYHTSLDLFGPILVKDTVKRRTKCKVYGVIFNCLVCRAVYIDLTEGYSTEDFLTTFKRFVALRGFPKMIHSDGGSQLVAANKELRQMMSTWNMSEILQFGSDQGMTWSFNKAADAPWQNGCSEALIKVVKKSIMMSVGDSILTFGELQTVLFEVANLTNERPIGIKPGTDLDLGSYLCPNDLILGRTSIKVPSDTWTNTINPKPRLEFIQKIVENFWRRWQRDYFPTLVIRQKWHVSKRNVVPGDIVLLQDSNAVIGKWKLAQIVEATQGQDGKVRNVTVRYKNPKPGMKYEGEPDVMVKRSVHKLVVLLPVEEQCI